MGTRSNGFSFRPVKRGKPGEADPAEPQLVGIGKQQVLLAMFTLLITKSLE